MTVEHIDQVEKTERMVDERSGADLVVEGLRHSFGDRVIFDGLVARFREGELTCILGASGVGKSTLLRMMATLLKPDTGEIWFGDQELTRLTETRAKSHRRRVGMMFQGGALLDSMTVFENVALPLREHRDLGAAEIADRGRLEGGRQAAPRPDLWRHA